MDYTERIFLPSVSLPLVTSHGTPVLHHIKDALKVTAWDAYDYLKEKSAQKVTQQHLENIFKNAAEHLPEEKRIAVIVRDKYSRLLIVQRTKHSDGSLSTLGHIYVFKKGESPFLFGSDYCFLGFQQAVA